MVKLNEASVALIKENEGLRTTAYYDSVGVITIGYGSARTFRGRPIYEGMTITEEEAELALQEDVERYQNFLGFFKKGFNDNQIGALTSFEYNLGGGIYTQDGWNPNYNDSDILESMNNYRNPPEISSRRDREIAFYQLPPSDDNVGISEHQGEVKNPDPPIPIPEENKATIESFVSEQIKKAIDTIIDKVVDLTNIELYDFSKNSIISNSIITVTKTYSNTYKLKLSKNKLKEIVDSFTLNNLGLQEIKPKPPTPNPPDVPAKPNIVASNEIMDKLYNWCYERQGQSYVDNPEFGAQCVALIIELNKVYSLGLDLSSLYAKDIYNNSLPIGWKKIQGNPNDDTASKEIWNTLPNGAIVWFTNSYAGHVGIKAGEWAMTLNQNVDDPSGGGGPIRLSQLNTWITSGGAGFLGAWVVE